MPRILKVHNVNDYARYIGAEELHPLISVIHYDELEHCRHSLNNYDVYGIFIADEQLDALVYVLLTSGHTIGETSDLLGFEYPQHFTRMFKKFYGYPPSKIGRDGANPLFG